MCSSNAIANMPLLPSHSLVAVSWGLLLTADKEIIFVTAGMLIRQLISTAMAA
jgi:hypothetical protein